MNNLFEILGSKFFNILTANNKEIYIDCIFIIYNNLDNLEDAFQGDREAIISRLIDYFAEIKEEAIIKDAKGNIINNNREKAVSVLHYLKSCGWLGEEELGNYRVSLFFYEHAIRLIDLLQKFMSQEDSEYSGQIYSIYSVLHHFNEDVGLGIIEDAFNMTQEIALRLKTLKANIYRFYEEFNQKKGGDNPKSVFEGLFVKYRDMFFDRAYYNLTTKDSLSKFGQDILKDLHKIHNNAHLMDKLALQVKKDKSIEDYSLAFNYIEKRILSIRNSFVTFSTLMYAIEKKNEQYIKVVSSRIMFLTNRNANIEGTINKYISHILKYQDDFEISESNTLFNILNIKFLSDFSFYVNRRKPLSMEGSNQLIDNGYSQESMFNIMGNILNINPFPSVEEISDYVLELLEDDDKLEAKNVPLNDDIDYLKLILIFNYATSSEIKYKIEVLGDRVRHNDIVFTNFLIMRNNGQI